MSKVVIWQALRGFTLVSSLRSSKKKCLLYPSYITAPYQRCLTNPVKDGPREQRGAVIEKVMTLVEKLSDSEYSLPSQTTRSGRRAMTGRTYF